MLAQVDQLVLEWQIVVKDARLNPGNHVGASGALNLPSMTFDPTKL